MRLALVISLLLPLTVFGQVRCGLTDGFFQEHQRQSELFEDWITKTKNLQHSETGLFARTDESQPLLEIPVVFHVIHNGEAVGTGGNLSDDKILEQLSILNADYRRLNADTTETPSTFTDIAADTRIQFVLARQDPEGRPTTGIVRKLGSQSRYQWTGPDSEDDLTLKGESRWPPGDYLNIYIADLFFSANTNLLGYATFPFSDVEGIDQINNNTATDGVAVDYEYVGINADAGAFTSFGRTLVHEIGHYLGLRHVWGDGLNCSSDDFVEDTPLQSKSYSGECPSGMQSTCSSADMYSNYLNYTDDGCMNIFSAGQADRMRFVLQNSPKRASLLTSEGLTYPIVYDVDLGIKSIISPAVADCNEIFLPTVELRNYGLDSVKDFTISLLRNDVLLETKTIQTELAPNQLSVVSFEEVNMPSEVNNRITFNIVAVNSNSDENLGNNQKTIEISPFREEGLPYSLDFDSKILFESRAQSGESLWEIVNAPGDEIDNSAARFGFYLDSSRFGEFDYLITPVFDLSSLNSAEVSFKYAYARNSSNPSKDGLIFAISTDCGATYQNANFLFERYGTELATAPEADSVFVPSSPSDWEDVNINLTAFTGESNVRFAFIAHQANGNFIYVDDIQISSNSLKAYDLGIRSIKNIPQVTCDDFVIPTAEIKNHGFETIESFKLKYTIVNNSSEELLQRIIQSGELTNVAISVSNLDDGEYNIQFEVLDPNGLPDEFPENNIFDYHMVVNNSEDILPLRQNFESDNNDWVITNQDDKPIWKYTKLGANTVLKADAFTEKELGTEHFFVSPILSTADLDEASMRFRYAYAGRGNARDRLRVLASVNCGREYQFNLFDETSEELSDMVLNEAFVPTEDSLWQEVKIDLSQYLRFNDLRIAFVFVNGNGNNLFIDDIEFFVQSSPPELIFDDPVTLFPNPASDNVNLLFNLPDRAKVNVTISDLSGKIIYKSRFENVLNQQFSIPLTGLEGLYLLNVSGHGFQETEKIIIE